MIPEKILDRLAMRAMVANAHRDAEKRPEDCPGCRAMWSDPRRADTRTTWEVVARAVVNELAAALADEATPLHPLPPPRVHYVLGGEWWAEREWRP